MLVPSAVIRDLKFIYVYYTLYKYVVSSNLNVLNIWGTTIN